MVSLESSLFDPYYFSRVVSGYATASVEGRIAVEYFDPSPEAQEKTYAFKCHRQTISEEDHVWPVNSLTFHPLYVAFHPAISFLPFRPFPPAIRYNTFASAGSDGTVSIWDHHSKKRLRQYHKYNGPIPSIAFNRDGTRLAVGVSYTWDEGETGAKTAERPAVWIRNVGEEVKVWLCPCGQIEELKKNFCMQPKGWTSN